MKTAIIVHGMPGKEEPFRVQSEQHWIPWLRQKLLEHEILAQAPEMPNPTEPGYAAWRAVFEGFPIDANTHLIGHSCGAGFLVRWLSDNKEKRVGKVVLVAPWMDPKGEMADAFFDFESDPDLVRRTDGVTIFLSRDDDPEIHVTVERLEKDIVGIQKILLDNRKHFKQQQMGTEEFPELLEVLL